MSKRTIILVFSMLVILLIVGLVQNYMNDSTRGCRRYDASTKNYGFDCGGKKIYKLKQQSL